MLYLNKLQHRLWVDDAIQNSNLYNVAYAFRLEGELDTEKLQDSLRKIVAANPVFRSQVKPDGRGVFYFHKDDTFVLPFEEVSVSSGCRNEEELETVIDYYARIPLREDSDYLCKFYLFGLGERQWIFMPKFHHSVMDGMSMNAFCGQLSTLYNGESLPEIPTMEAYNAYARQTDCRPDEDYLYWKEYLSGVPLNVSVGHFDGPEAEHDGRYNFKLGEKLFHRCDRFCLSEKTTQFRLLAAVWASTVGRFCQPESGTVVLDHTVNLCADGFADTLGNYVNNLPLKIRTTSSLHEILSQIREDRRLAKQHQWITYTELIPGMKNEKLLASANDRINIGLDYPIINNRLGFNFRRCASLFFRQPQMNLGLDLCLAVEKGSEFRCHIRYKKHIPLYYVKELADAFRLLLIQSTEAPFASMEEFPLLTKDRTQTLMEQQTGRIQLPPDNQSVMDRFTQVTFINTCRTAIICGPQRICYSELYAKAMRIALQISREEKKPGYIKAPVGILMKRTPDSIAALLGILASGNAYVPLDIESPAERLKYILKDCGIRLLITDKLLTWETDGLSILNPETEPICGSGEFFFENKNKVTGTDLAYVIYTSGTTGYPKGIPILHRQLLNMADEQAKLFQIDSDSRVLYFASMSFDASVSELFTALLAGACLVIATEAERKSPQLLLDLLEQEKVTCATLPPALLAVLPYRPLPCWETLVVAGDKCPPQIIARWMKGRRFINAYGPTENTVCTTAAVLDDTCRAHNIGHPLANVTCYVLDKKMNLLPFGIPGELHIGGLQLTGGYLNRPELNEKKFVANPFVSLFEKEKGVNTILYKSGDHVRLLPDHSIEFIGRIDGQLKIRGFRVEPGEIEQAILRYPNVEQVYVSTKEGNREKVLAAYLQPRIGHSTDPDAVKSFLASILPAYMIPVHWVILKEFPRNVNGKIDVSRLPEPELQEKTNVSPGNPQEAALLKIVSHLLETEAIGVESDLPELGMDSLNVMQFVVEAEKAGIRVTVSSVYRNRTIRKIIREQEDLPYFWYNKEYKEKPVVVVVCGHPLFYKQYYAFAEAFSEKYALFVLDSYNGYYKEEWACVDLIDYYYDILCNHVLKDNTIFAITGHCLGGELGLLLANKLNRELGLIPKIWMMDGEAVRVPASISRIRFLDDPTVSARTNEKINRILQRLLGTFLMEIYPGEVQIALSGLPMTHLQFDIRKPENPAELEIARQQHEARPRIWKKYYPDAPVIYVDTEHYRFLVKKYIPVLQDFFK